MGFKQLEEFIALAKKEHVTSLKYQKGDEKFEVSFASITPTTSATHNHDSASNVSEGNFTSGADSALVEVTSPYVGTFYSRPNPETEPYINVGDKVEKGQVLCLVEAMKLFNEIKSDVDGVVVDISVENSSVVEYDQVIFRIRPS